MKFLTRAGEGNRTLVVGLGSRCSTIELHPREAAGQTDLPSALVYRSRKRFGKQSFTARRAERAEETGTGSGSVLDKGRL